jgi:zinc protease
VTSARRDQFGQAIEQHLAGSLGSLRHLDRTMLWEAELEKKISALTPEQISASMKRHIDPKKLVVVSAGDFGDDKKSETVR